MPWGGGGDSRVSSVQLNGCELFLPREEARWLAEIRERGEKGISGWILADAGTVKCRRSAGQLAIGIGGLCPEAMKVEVVKKATFKRGDASGDSLSYFVDGKGRIKRHLETRCGFYH
uniref:XdhC_CoxI domain-containing protein n=1 Tax=Panagrellus redivivus TaxID=6233 RepID=A0A7E4VXN4_PANRE